MLEIRQRTGWLFVVVVVAHVILISAQAKTGRGVPMLETVIFGAFAEVQRAATTAVGGAQRAWQDYFALQEIRHENEALKQQVAQLQIGLQQERAVAEQGRALQTLLELKQGVPIHTAAARVIGGGASPDFRTITIDKGSDDGIGPDMAVIAPTGVVGRVIQPSARAAKVQLLIDNDAAVGGIIERTGVQGVVEGKDGGLRLEYVTSSADLKAGDRVVTSGLEGIFPDASIPGKYTRGFVIGQVQSFERAAGSYRNVVVKPAVDFTSLDTVLVVLTRPPDAVLETATSGVTRGNGER